MYSVIMVFLMSVMGQSNEIKNVNDIVVQVPNGKELNRVCNDMKVNHNEIYKMYKNGDIVFKKNGNNEIMNKCLKIIKKG